MKTKEIPLEPQDVPPGSIVGKFDNYGKISFWHLVLTANPLGVIIADRQSFAGSSSIILKRWDRLAFHGWSIKRPGSDKWERCVKYVEDEKP